MTGGSSAMVHTVGIVQEVIDDSGSAQARAF